MTTPINRRTLFTAAMGASAVSAMSRISVASPDAAPAIVERIKFASVASMYERRPQESSASHQATVRVEANPFRLMALTWGGTSDVTARMRSRTDGQWTRWETVQGDDHHADDSGDSSQTRRGTQPVFVPRSDAVEVAITAPSSVPDDLIIELIDPGTAPLDNDLSAAHPQAAGTPTIRRRSAWGADETVRESGKPRYGQVRGAFVHHTVGANGYSRSDVPSIIRGIYAYHVVGRGWRDIGYNFLVDRFGRIWEGRYGGIAKPVVGAHALNYNSYAFGASVLGTYTNNKPTTATLHALADLIAWKFRVHKVDPRHVSYPNIKDVPAIAGHRDGGATACPGDVLYARLSTVRGLVAKRMR